MKNKISKTNKKKVIEKSRKKLKNREKSVKKLNFVKLSIE
jgi:hypothetical protein